MIIYLDTTRFIWEVLENNEYSFLFKDLVVVDVGCNTGAFSLWIYDHAKEIHAIDISSRNIELLDKTIKDNNYDKIKTYSCGIAAKTGNRNIETVDAPAGSGGWKLGSGNGDIDVYSLEDFLNKNHIEVVDVLKMDVEGAEYEILANFPQERVNTVIGECHGESLEGRFRNLGYRYVEHGNHFVARKI